MQAYLPHARCLCVQAVPATVAAASGSSETNYNTSNLPSSVPFITPPPLRKRHGPLDAHHSPSLRSAYKRPPQASPGDNDNSGHTSPQRSLLASREGTYPTTTAQNNNNYNNYNNYNININNNDNNNAGSRDMVLAGVQFVTGEMINANRSPLRGVDYVAADRMRSALSPALVGQRTQTRGTVKYRSGIGKVGSLSRLFSSRLID
jgi:hypothetical protein